MTYPLLSKQMPECIKKVWWKRNLAFMIIFLAIGSVVVTIMKVSHILEEVWLLLAVGYFVLMVSIFVINQLLIPYRYKFHRYELTPEDVAFQKGYIFRSITYVPINRIQHVETEQGPFLRKENLMEIIIYTASTNHHLPGLNGEDAMMLRKQIIDMVKVVKEDV